MSAETFSLFFCSMLIPTFLIVLSVIMFKSGFNSGDGQNALKLFIILILALVAMTVGFIQAKGMFNKLDMNLSVVNQNYFNIHSIEEKNNFDKQLKKISENPDYKIVTFNFENKTSSIMIKNSVADIVNNFGCVLIVNDFINQYKKDKNKGYSMTINDKDIKKFVSKIFVYPAATASYECSKPTVLIKSVAV